MQNEEKLPPAITVVIPSYNRAHVIGQAVASVLAQSISDYEIVIVDDGSTDDTESTLARLADPRIKIVRQSNGGGAKARNAGIDHAKGRYIAFLDSDDTFLPHHLQTMLEITNSRENIVAYAQVIVDRNNGDTFIKPPRAPEHGESMAEYLCCSRGFVQTSTLFVPTVLARKVRYREGMRFGQDTDFAIRLSFEPCQFVMAEKPAAVWNDAFDPTRVSALRKGVSNLPWIEELRPHISARAYHGYRGWHIAKGVAKSSTREAFQLYLSAVRHGSYRMPLAFIVFCQIFFSDAAYRRMTDVALRLKHFVPIARTRRSAD